LDGGAGAWGGGDLEAAEVGRDDGGGAGEAEAEVAWFGGEVGVEEAWEGFGRDAIAFVGDFDDDPGVGGGGVGAEAGGDAEEAAVGHGVFGVFEQGEEGFAEGGFVEFDGGEVLIGEEFEAGLTAEEGHGEPAIEEEAEVGAAAAGGSGGGAGEGGEGADGGFGVFAGVGGVFEQALGFGARGILFGEEVDVAADGGEGVVEAGGGAGGDGAGGFEAGVAEAVGFGATGGADVFEAEAEGGSVGPEAAADLGFEVAGSAVGAAVGEVAEAERSGGFVPVLEDVIAAEEAGEEEGDEAVADFLEGQAEEVGGGGAGLEDEAVAGGDDEDRGGGEAEEVFEVAGLGEGVVAIFLFAPAPGDAAFGHGDAEVEVLAFGETGDEVVDAAGEPIEGAGWRVVEEDGEDVGQRVELAAGEGAQKRFEGGSPALTELDDKAIRGLRGESGGGLLEGVGGAGLVAAIADGFDEQVAGGAVGIDDQGAHEVEAVGLDGGGYGGGGRACRGSGGGGVGWGTGRRHQGDNRGGLFNF
jgi:hypothetical protein